MTDSLAQFQRVKSHIESGIEEGKWACGDRIPSENELSKQFSLSRMTINRAIRELADQGILERVQGKGTFVATPRSLSSVLAISDIADEIRSRGNVYTSQLISNRITSVTPQLAERIPLPSRSSIARSVLIHFENEIPLQVERRWVNPAIAPDYARQ